MKISEQWLYEWVAPAITMKELVEQLTMAGLEVDAVIPAAADFSGVVIAAVRSVEPHPNADRLRVCKVSLGDGHPELTIVCGAHNVRAGLKVALATIGAKLPDFTIKRSKLRGVESEGMICSTQELGIADNADGILELPEDALLGQDIRQYLHLDDHIIEIDVTPNRGDCLSIKGIAREVAALNKLTLTTPPWTTSDITLSDSMEIEIKAPEACPHYVGRVINYKNLAAKTPPWLEARLRKADIRLIHPVVDITNYVMLELGQPLHSFDRDKIDNKMVVRFSKEGEIIDCLNGQSVSLKPNTLIIADKSKPLAIAGIIGGSDSGVIAETNTIFLESAFFAPQCLAGVARSYGLNTDSSYRFERGVDPQLQLLALERATQLIVEIMDGQAGAVTTVSSTANLPAKAEIRLAKNKVARYLGLAINEEEISGLLTYLGLQVRNDGDEWLIIPPSYRFDINTDVDVIEEIVRIYGYQKIPSQLPSAMLPKKINSELELSANTLRQCLLARGYQEIITNSFVSEHYQQLLDPDNKPLPLVNPISSDLAVMRTNLWTGLLTTVLYNQNRQKERLRLFEIGMRFLQTEQGLQQELVVAGVITKTLYSDQWASAPKAVDFYDIKADVEALLTLTGFTDSFFFNAYQHPALHPGQTAMITKDDEILGLVGALHPHVQQQLQCLGPIYLFELKLKPLLNRKMPSYKSFSKFPAIRRDIAVVIDQTYQANEILTAIKASAGPLLIEAYSFDVYEGQGIPQGKKSLAFSLTLQHESRTLIDDEVNEIINNIINQLNESFAATLRE